MSASIRLDKWLWQARFVRSRTLAQGFLETHIVRVNRVPAAKTSTPVAVGDVLTLPFERGVRVVRVLALGTRRGPPAEARSLYEEILDLS